MGKKLESLFVLTISALTNKQANFPLGILVFNKFHVMSNPYVHDCAMLTIGSLIHSVHLAIWLEHSKISNLKVQQYNI